MLGLGLMVRSLDFILSLTRSVSVGALVGI